MRVALRHFQQSMRRRWRREGAGFRRILLTILVFGVYLLLLFGTRLVPYLDNHLLRLWFNIRGERSAPASVMVIGIDDETYRDLGLSTIQAFPREQLAELLEKLSAAPPKLAVLDIFFLSKGTSPATDLRLASALRSVPTVIGKFSRKGADFAPQPLFAESAKAVIPLEVNVDLASGLASDLLLPSQFVPAGESRIPLLKPLSEGYRVRELPEEGALINYYGGPGAIRTESFSHALKQIPPEEFKDKLLFIGFELEATFGSSGNDSFMTAASGARMYGVEHHATVASNLIDGSWLRRLGHDTEDRLITALALIIIYSAFCLRPARAVALIVFCVASWSLGSYWAFARWHLFVPGSVFFIVVLPLLLLTATLFHYRASTTALRETQRAFGLKAE